MRSAKPTVLVVDDDKDLLLLVRYLLEELDLRVLAHASSLGVSRLIIGNKPQLMLLDLNMPGLSGDGLAKVLASMGPDLQVPFVFFSGRPEAELKELSTLHNALGFIRKPIERQSFQVQVKGFVDMLELR